MSVLEKIFTAVKEDPGRTAFMSVSGTLTYEELWEKSGKLASYIDEAAVENRDPVVVYGHKSPYMPVCFLACVRSGRAYCPVDVSMPEERIRDIAAETGSPLILAAEQMPYEAEGMITPEKMDGIIGTYPEISPDKAVSGDEVFYIIFTSGSTGRPKGVQITEKNLDSFVSWSADLFGGPGVFMNQAPYSFDLSVMDTYTALTSGGTVASLDKALLRDMNHAFGFIRDSGVEYFVSTPSFANLLLADRQFSSEGFPKISRFVFCGEKLTKETAAKLFERFPDAKVINTYGPTEATVAVSSTEVTSQMLEDDRTIPVGRPKPGTDIYVDNDELIIAGDSVSPGYYMDEVKTAKAFFTAPDGRQCYRTGDSGQYDDGMLYFSGRLDSQIKMNGYRIELEDIENNLLKLDGVGAAAVMPRYDGETIKSLTAFVSPRDSGAEPEGRKLRKALREKLPSYMIPKKIKVLDMLPVNSNGKINRKKLEELL